jgi:ribosomal protein S18 acetylase RimI-like enzyme
VTAASGDDATGILEDDDIWANMFVLPYVRHASEFAFVLESGGDEVVGYVVAAPDTDAFEDWFCRVWWPQFTQRWPRPTRQASRQDEVLEYAYSRRSGLNQHVAQYPAHLHISLLPEAQRQGWGRRLIDCLRLRLREAGVDGLHLAALADNGRALAFYQHIGFTVLGQEPPVVIFGLRLQ